MRSTITNHFLGKAFSTCSTYYVFDVSSYTRAGYASLPCCELWCIADTIEKPSEIKKLTFMQNMIWTASRSSVINGNIDALSGIVSTHLRTVREDILNSKTAILRLER